VDLTSGETAFVMELVGCSSPDGSDGELSDDMSHLTTAKDIVEKVTIIVE
jgi:hypothetical protein